MTAERLDNFDYRPASGYVSEALRKHYWAVAIGLQDVDGLTAPHLCAASDEYVAGQRTLAEVCELVQAHHNADNDEACTEKDLVSLRIAELLSSGAFALVPEILGKIHAYLFQDLDPNVYHPGEFKTERMENQEEILNGDSVMYADPMTYQMSLQGAF